MTKLVTMKARTFTAKLLLAGQFKVAGTLDGFVDLATPQGTYALSLSEALELAKAIADAVADVQANCLYEDDVLLERRKHV